MDIKFYTSHCPKCKVLKKLMDDKDIKYEEIDNEEVYLPLAESNNIKSMPFGEINGNVVNTKCLIEFINNKGETNIC